MPEQETVFADGLSFKYPSEKAPKWIKGNISVKVDKFLEFLNAHPADSGWINIDVKESKGGKIYCQLNTYKKGDKKTTTATGPSIDAEDEPF